MRQANWTVPAGMIGIAGAALLVWQELARFPLVASPLVAAETLWEGLAQGWILPHAAATFGAALIGFALAAVLGVAGGALLGSRPFARQVVEPILLGLFAIPKITLYPVLLLVFGVGPAARIAMALIHAVFPILMNVMTGVSEVPVVMKKMSRSVGCSPWQTLRFVYLPAIAPELVAGLRMGISLAIIGVVLSELFASKQGLGRVIMDFYARLQVEQMFSVIAFLFILAVLLNLSLWGLERRLRRYSG